MKRKKKSSIAGKLIVSTVMAIFLVYAIFLFALNLFGTKTFAKITSYRMEMFERDETIRNRYTFVFSYEFVVSGKNFDGRSREIKGPVYLKNKGGSIPIAYLKCCPYLNAPVRDFQPFYKPFIHIFIAMVLLWFLRRF